MLVRRIFAWCFLSLALSMLGPEVLFAVDAGHYYPLTLLDFWKHFGPHSLEIAGTLGQNPIAYWVWDPVMTTLLKLPGWSLPGVISLYLFATLERQPAHKPLLH
jgi:hypothetical protein